jgi:inner membrane protein involved in colicin E2 resistance
MESRIKPFGCAPVIYGLFITSIVLFYGDLMLGEPDAFSAKVNLSLNIILTLMTTVFFISPIYIITVLIAKKKIILHLIVALLVYLILWTILLATQQSPSLLKHLEFIAQKTITYWLLYCLFFTTLLITWKIYTRRDLRNHDNKTSPPH